MTVKLRRSLLAMVLILGLLSGLGSTEPARGGVHVIPVQGEIEPGLAKFLTRALQRAEAQGAEAVMIEIGTLGGLVNAALDIRDALVHSRVKTVAFVRDRAWSAGALIAISAEELIMAPGSSIGAAEPIPLTDKTLSAVRKEFETTAARRARNDRVAGAMVDKNVKVPGIDQAGPLTLSWTQAKEFGIANDILDSRQQVLSKLGFSEADVVETAPTISDRIARFLSSTAVAPILLTLGFVGLTIEIFTPGFGIPGLLGLASLGLFFGGHLVAGFAGWEVVALFMLGSILMAIEAFVPGFGFFGILGILSVIGGIMLASASLEQAVQSLAIALIATVVVMVIGARQATRKGLFGRLTLRDTLNRAEGYVAPPLMDSLVNREGVTITTLRPAGAAEIDGRRVDVVTDGDFIDPGTKVKVAEVVGTRVVVRPVEEGGSTVARAPAEETTRPQ